MLDSSRCSIKSLDEFQSHLNLDYLVLATYSYILMTSISLQGLALNPQESSKSDISFTLKRKRETSKLELTSVMNSESSSEKSFKFREAAKKMMS